MFDFIKKIKNLFSGKKAPNQKQGAKNRPSNNPKNSSRPPIPPSRDHEFKRSRPGTSEQRRDRRPERDAKKSGPKNGQPQSFEKRPRQGRKPADSKSPRRDSFAEHRERRGRLSERKTAPERNSKLQNTEVKISPELVLTDWNPADFTVEPAEGKKRFHDFNFPEPIMHAVYDLGFKYCTPIQAASLEQSLAGANVAGRAQTGTGKTAAYLLTVLTRYLNGVAQPAESDPAATPDAASTTADPAAADGAPAAEAKDEDSAAPAENAEEKAQAPSPAPAQPVPQQRPNGAPRALVLAPTRELCVQIANDAKALGKYCGLRSMAVFGGMDYARQARELQEAPLDLLAATPGRLLDFLRQHIVDLSKIDTLVIDEADRMLDMGFIPDVRRIIRALPLKRQTLLYSATLNDEVMRLASQWMPNPVKVEIEPEKTANQSIDQKIYIVTSSQKFTILCHLLDTFKDQRVLVFGNRRASTDHLAESLRRQGYDCELLSGEVSQGHRMKVLEAFREGTVKLVVATDVAGRGLHIADIGLVVNFELPYEAEDYVHRIGRTGRAGKVGTAVSFADEDESFIIPDIETYIGEELKCSTPDDELLLPLPPPARRRSRRPERNSAKKEGACEGASENEQPGEKQEVATEQAVAPADEAPAEAKAPPAAEEKTETPADVKADAPAETKTTPEEPSADEKVDAAAPAAEPAAIAKQAPRQASPQQPQQHGQRRSPKAVVLPKGGMHSQTWSPGQK